MVDMAVLSIACVACAYVIAESVGPPPRGNPALWPWSAFASGALGFFLLMVGAILAVWAVVLFVASLLIPAG
jgi:hypothetical protein